MQDSMIRSVMPTFCRLPRKFARRYHWRFSLSTEAALDLTAVSVFVGRLICSLPLSSPFGLPSVSLGSRRLRFVNSESFRELETDALQFGNATMKAQFPAEQ